MRAVAVGFLVALAAHVVLGWMFSVAGAVASGYMVAKRGWAAGAAALMAAWGAIILFQYIRAPAQVSEMARVVASLMGNLPAFMTFVITLALACLLGMAGGALGASAGALRGRGA